MSKIWSVFPVVLGHRSEDGFGLQESWESGILPATGDEISQGENT